MAELTINDLREVMGEDLTDRFLSLWEKPTAEYDRFVSEIENKHSCEKIPVYIIPAETLQKMTDSDFEYFPSRMKAEEMLLEWVQGPLDLSGFKGRSLYDVALAGEKEKLEMVWNSLAGEIMD